jgi:nucleoside-diphosphate-sugar epimerase
MEVSQVYASIIGKPSTTGERLLAGFGRICVTPRMTDPVHIIGASGRSGGALVRALACKGGTVVPVVRDAGKWAATGMRQTPRVADLLEPAALRASLAGATAIVSCAHARHAPAIIATAPPDARLFFLGSTRKFTRWPDDHGNGVLAGEAAFLSSGRRGAMLHPTMIYGAQGENNVQRLAGILRKLPLVPLPNGGASLVQPVHQDDVTAALLAALDRDWAGPESMVVAGPTAMSYADFIRTLAAAAGLPAPRIVAVPAWLPIAAAWIMHAMPFLPDVEPAEVRRLLEDKAFDIAPARLALGFDPIPFREGLARTFGNPHHREKA